MIQAPPKKAVLARVEGFTLIEILIALLVLSIGLIGIAAMHLVSLQNAHSSFHSSLASSIALDFEERLWLRVGKAGAGPSCIQITTDPTDPAEIATALESVWQNLFVAPDDQGDGGLSVSIGPGSSTSTTGVNYEVQVPLTISWSDARFNGTNSFEYLVRVPCFDPQF